MTFGEPSGARGGSNGDQSATESRTSTLTTPLNGSVMEHPQFGATELPTLDATRTPPPRPVRVKSVARPLGRSGEVAGTVTAVEGPPGPERAAAAAPVDPRVWAAPPPRGLRRYVPILTWLP